jgi:hypothetical protein
VSLRAATPHSYKELHGQTNNHSTEVRQKGQSYYFVEGRRSLPQAPTEPDAGAQPPLALEAKS